MSEIITFKPRQQAAPVDPNMDLRAALAAADLLQRAEASATTARAIARTARLKAACDAATHAIHRARQIANEELSTTPPKGAA